MPIKKVDYLKIEELLDRGYGWSDIKDEFPDFTDSDRKRYYGFRDGLEMFSERFNEDRLMRKEQNIRLERKRLGYERSINNEQIRDLALRETLSKQLDEALQKQDKYKTFPITRKVFEGAYDGNADHHVFTLGDLHHDGDIQTTSEVFSLTLEAIVKEVSRYKLHEITIIELGDLIEGAGNLRASQAQAVRSGMIEQMVEVMTLYAQFLRDLSQYVKVNFVTVTSSNHTQLRLMGSKQNELVEEDLMIMFAKYIEGMLPDLNVIKDKQPIIDIRGFKCLVVHGHTVSKNQIEDEISKASNYRNELIDFMFMGHYHHYQTKDITVARKQNLYGNLIEYDKRVFMIPGMVQETGNFEHDLKVSSIPGIGHYSFNNIDGNVISEKIKITT